MGTGLSLRTVDLAVVAVANVINLLMAGLFLARTAGHARLETSLGVAVIAMAVPLAGAVYVNASHGREWWTVALVLPVIAFCVVELVFDFILQIPFRTTWMLWPYLALYYLGVLALIGYGFGVGRALGFVTLATYFLALGASWYAHTGARTAV